MLSMRNPANKVSAPAATSSKDDKGEKSPNSLHTVTESAEILRLEDQVAMTIILTTMHNTDFAMG